MDKTPVLHAVQYHDLSFRVGQLSACYFSTFGVHRGYLVLYLFVCLPAMDSAKGFNYSSVQYDRLSNLSYDVVLLYGLHRPFLCGFQIGYRRVVLVYYRPL